MREVSNVFFPLKLLRFQTNFKGGGGKGLAKGSMSRRSGQQQAGGGKDESETESAGRHERSFDQGGSQSKVIM